MPEENRQKIKLLKLMELLTRESDEKHPLTTARICEYLRGMGISCDRRTLTRDILVLNEYNYDVRFVMCGHEKGYYVQHGNFNEAELRMLMDTVQAANFLPEEETAALLHKLSGLTSLYRGRDRLKSLVLFNNRKHNNHSVLGNIHQLEDALRTGCRVSFRYFDLNEKHERVYRREGREYKMIPAALVYCDDFYYLVTYSHHYHSTTNYRIDRMDNVQVLTDEKVEQETVQELRGLDFAGYTKEVFRMFGGAPNVVRLRFDKELLGSVYDRFGEELTVKAADDGRLETAVRIQVSPTFYGWVFQFGSKMQIMGPARVVSRFKELAAGVLTGPEEAPEEEAPF